MPSRQLIGLSVGSGFEAADAAVVRVEGTGIGMTARVAGTSRVALGAEVRDAGRHLLRQADPWPTGFARELAAELAMAARKAVGAAGGDLRDVLCAGLLTRLPDANPDPDRPSGSVADFLAEQTGLTLMAGFRSRDVAAGGSGHLLTAAADTMFFRDPGEERLLVHLGSVTSVLLLPPGGKPSDVTGFEAGPGSRLLDDLTALGTRGRDACDHGGTRAVQGRCLEPLLTRWLAHPLLARKPPKAVPRAAFGSAFLTDAFESARADGGTLSDLLCTATHLVARCVGRECETWLPPASGIRRVLVSGGGTRNGFLWKLIEQQFPGQLVERLDRLGVPATSRSAAAAAVLAGLTLDGVAANLPLVTGAAGGRLVGRIIPGDQRNWSACVAWMAEQVNGYAAFPRAA
jgi:anhydro-N-acetylmuramic acid kinase